ncbi:MAG: DUF3696 domain-containing protein [Deltaproteobacteria bacterium]|nr:DUF3696 domain-containing protein [Deltaproteobacteria bacterium]
MANLPDHITLTQYKCFRDSITLDIKPVTLLFGRNNAGKSALIRSLAIISDSLRSGGVGAIDLDSSALRGTPFDSLVWAGEPGNSQNRLSPKQLEFGLGWAGSERPTLSLILQQYRDKPWNRVLIKAVSIHTVASGKTNLVCQTRPEDAKSQRLRYLADGETEVDLEFSGLLLNKASGYIDSAVASLQPDLKLFGDAVVWLPPTRTPPDRFTSIPSGPPARIQADGNRAVQILHTWPEIKEAVKGWYQDHLKRRLDIQEDIRGLRAQLRAGSMGTDLCDCGEGMTQVLPVLTALEMVRTRSRQPNNPQLLAIEEPEGHLNPWLQRELGRRVAEVGADCGDSRVVLETHSEQLLLGVQTAVAKGDILPEDVALHWVHQDPQDGATFVDKIPIDEKGRLQGRWPKSAFKESLEMARELLAVQLGEDVKKVKE